MLTIENLTKTFPGDARKARKGDDSATVYAVRDVSLKVEKGELYTFLGPSGCGKTTTLRSIAGLETPDSGLIQVGDMVVYSGGETRQRINVPANKRGLGMVFQSYAIWPHMSVFENVGFPLQVRPRNTRPSKAQIKERVERVLTVMELDHLADRQATKLSGGQQQRLALARALIIEPQLLLLDEPLSNLDAKLRESLRYELKRLQRELGITSIYVTHDQIEALALSSHIAVMKLGEVVQEGKPRDIYEHPNSRFVAEFIGTSNFIEGTISSVDKESVVVETDISGLTVPTDLRPPLGAGAIVSIRPEHVGITTDPPTDMRNVWKGTVATRAYLGDAVDHVVTVGKREIRARCAPHISVAAGQDVYLQFANDKFALVPLD